MCVYIEQELSLAHIATFPQSLDANMASQWSEVLTERSEGGTLKVSIMMHAEDGANIFLDLRRCFTVNGSLRMSKVGIRLRVEADGLCSIASVLKDIARMEANSVEVENLSLKRRGKFLQIKKVNVGCDITPRMLLCVGEVLFLFETLNSFSELLKHNPQRYSMIVMMILKKKFGFNYLINV